MSASFTSVSIPRETQPGRHEISFPDGWQQGRGAFGGLVLATMVRAIEATAASPDRPPRTLTAEICAPVHPHPSPAEILVEKLRDGSGTSTLAARLVQDGELRAHAVCVLGRRREGPSLDGLPRPAMPPWRETPVVALPPPFARHFEYRPTAGTPFSGGEPRVAGWVRSLASDERRDAAFVVALADAWFPALFPSLAGPRPMATLTFTLDWLGDLDGLDPEAPFFHEAHTLGAQGGYAPELRVLRGEDGRLVAVNHQTFVVIK